MNGKAHGLHPAILGPFGPAQLACLRSWRRLGLAPRFIHINDDGCAPGVRHLAAGYLPLTRSQWLGEEGVEKIAEFLTEQHCQGITCLAEGDARRLWTMAPRLPTHTALWIPELAVLARLASKLNQLEMARGAGFDLLPFFLGDRENVPTIAPDWFPLVARPDQPEAVQPCFKVRLLQDPTELARFLAGFSRIDGPILLQPLVAGPNLLIHGAADWSGSWSRFQAFQVARKFEGVALTITTCTLAPELEARCRAFCRLAGIVGCFHFDLIQDPGSGRSYFLEMNGRLGGTTAKALAAGYDEPRWLLRGFGALPEGDPPGLPPGVIVANRTAMLKYGLHHWRGLTTSLDHPHAGKWRAVGDLLQGSWRWRDEIADWRDPMGTLRYYADLLCRHRPFRS